MKRHSLKSIFFPVALVAMLVITGCTKDDGPIRKEYLDLIESVPVIATAIDNTGSPAIDVLNPASFQGKFTVSEFFDGPGSESPEKVDVVVRKNGGTGTDVKVFQAGVTTLPASYSVTTAQLEALFGAPVVVGDSYDFSVDIYTKSGSKFEAFPAGGVATSSGPTGVPGYSYMVRFGAICAYDPDIYEGDFEVVQDAWADWSPGDIVTLTRVSDNKFSFIDPWATAPRNPIVVTVNTGNNQASIPKTSAGAAWGWAVGTYTGAFVQTGGAATSSFVSPCAQTVTLNLVYMVDQGTFGGTYPLVLKKL